MNWHCGLLSAQPNKDRTLAWIKRGAWDTLPDDVAHEMRIWMAMPGFAINYHAQTMGLDKRYVAKFYGGYQQQWREVGENWLSATREDCVALCNLRAGGDVPVISQLSIIDDLKAGAKQVDVAREYAVSEKVTRYCSKGRIHFRGELPLGFAMLGGRLPEAENIYPL